MNEEDKKTGGMIMLKDKIYSRLALIFFILFGVSFVACMMYRIDIFVAMFITCLFFVLGGIFLHLWGLTYEKMDKPCKRE